MSRPPPWSGRRVAIDQRPPLVRFLGAQVPLYALLDAARDPEIYPLLQESGCHSASLFTEERAERLAARAPYLVGLEPGAPLLDALIPHWGADWGVYLSSTAPAADLLAHLRDLVWADTPDGVMLWRFYDPRVLRDLLPTCDGRRAAAFFGPIRAFYCAGSDPQYLLVCTAGPTGVAIETRPLDTLTAGQRVSRA